MQGFVVENCGVEIVALRRRVGEPVMTERVILNIFDLKSFEVIHASLEGTQLGIETRKEETELIIVVRSL